MSTYLIQILLQFFYQRFKKYTPFLEVKMGRSRKGFVTERREHMGTGGDPKK